MQGAKATCSGADLVNRRYDHFLTETAIPTEPFGNGADFAVAVASGLEKKLGDFNLKTGEGQVHQSEVVGVVGPNGTGKSTMIKILAGEHEYDAGWVTEDASISYKPQHINIDMDLSLIHI